MTIRNVFDVSARAMSAQMTRLNTIASNIANAGSTFSRAEDVFQPLHPVFETEFSNKLDKTGISTVNVSEIVQLDRGAQQLYSPDHPKADADGFIYKPFINPEEEMVEMMEASRQYQNNLQVVSTLRTLMARTVQMGK